MLKKMAQFSSLAFVLALGLALPASATEEDIAAPHGSFTSDMSVPGSSFAERFGGRHERFAAWMTSHESQMRDRWMARHGADAIR